MKLKLKLTLLFITITTTKTITANLVIKKATQKSKEKTFSLTKSNTQTLKYQSLKQWQAACDKIRCR